MNFKPRFHVPAFAAVLLTGAALLGSSCASPPPAAPPKNLKVKACTTPADCEPEPVCANSHACISGECAYTRGPGSGCPCYEGEVRECEISGVLGYQVCEKTGPASTQWGGCGCPAGAECNPDGVTRCRPGGTPASQLCQGGKWVTTDCRRDETCENGRCICARDATRCEGEIPQRCVGGVWDGTRNCESQLGGSACRNGTCACPRADQSPCDCKDGRRLCLTAAECTACRR
jgi:hypothetical protein